MGLMLMKLIRVVAGVVGAWQLVGLFPALTWVAAPSQVTPWMWVLVIVKACVLFVCVLVYIGIKRAEGRIGASPAAASQAAE